MKDYIHELRSRVGHWPVIMVGAGVIVLDDAGRILLMHRSDNGAWSIPGGMTEPGETVEETARREVRTSGTLTPLTCPNPSARPCGPFCGSTRNR